MPRFEVFSFGPRRNRETEIWHEPVRAVAGVGVVLVGTKMLVNAWFDAKIIPTELALLGTALLIGGSMLVSVIKTRHLHKETAAAEAIHGWVPGSPAEVDSGKASPSRSLGTSKKVTDKKDS